jgi:hypothetical protein
VALARCIHEDRLKELDDEAFKKVWASSGRACAWFGTIPKQRAPGCRGAALLAFPTPD